MSKVYALWVDKMLKSREEARSLREMLSFTKKTEQDPLLEYLIQFRSRMGQARRLLTDGEDRLLLRDAARSVAHRGDHPFHRLAPGLRHPGGRGGGQHGAGPAGPSGGPEFVLNRLQMQDDHMKTIWEKFDGSVRAIVPLFDQEVRGVPMLDRVARSFLA